MIEPVEAYLYSSDGKQPGDPGRAAEAMIVAVESDNSPLRLLLGADAIGLWEKKEAALAAELIRWRSVGEATAFEGATVAPVGRLRTSMRPASPLALVTGANRGIGLEVCRQLAQLGMRVLLGARDSAKGRAAAAALAREALDVRPVTLDMTSMAGTAASFAAEDTAIDVLVNNAGVDYDTDQTPLQADLARVSQSFETNLLGAWGLAQAVAPGMRRRGWGRIVNVSSGAASLADMGGGGPPGYSVSKAALNVLTRLLAAELKGTSVLVNSVCPGWVATDMGSSGGRPVRDGAASVTWAALLPEDGPSGGFFRDGEPVAW